MPMIKLLATAALIQSARAMPEKRKSTLLQKNAGGSVGRLQEEEAQDIPKIDNYEYKNQWKGVKRGGCENNNQIKCDEIDAKYGGSTNVCSNKKKCIKACDLMDNCASIEWKKNTNCLLSSSCGREVEYTTSDDWTDWQFFVKVQTEESEPEPVDCVYTMKASQCTATCGGGSFTLTPEVTVQPSNGGTLCPKPLKRGCNSKECPVDCKLAKSWSQWNPCECASTSPIKTRSRKSTPARNGGKPCAESDLFETDTCANEECFATCYKKAGCKEQNDWGTEAAAASTSKEACATACLAQEECVSYEWQQNPKKCLLSKTCDAKNIQSDVKGWGGWIACLRNQIPQNASASW